MRFLAATVVAAALVVGLPMAGRGSSEDDSALHDSGARRIEVPVAGLAFALPEGWRVAVDHPDATASSLVVVTNLWSSGLCELRDFHQATNGEYTTGEVADILQTGARLDPDGEFVAHAEVVLPAGTGIRLDRRERIDADAWLEQSDYLVTIGDTVAWLYCHTGDEAPPDRWRGLAETIEAIPVGDGGIVYDFDERVVLPHLGFKLDFPEEWVVGALTTRSQPEPVFRGVHALSPDGPCSAHDMGRTPQDRGWQGLDDMAEWDAGKSGGRKAGSNPSWTSQPDVRSGSTVRWSPRTCRTARGTCSPMVARGQSLVLRGRPAADRWLSIAETIEFLPAEE